MMYTFVLKLRIKTYHIECNNEKLQNIIDNAITPINFYTIIILLQVDKIL